MMNFTNADRRAGHKAMEESLTPMQKALRKFLSGRPPVPENTPLGAVILVTEQRKRLVKFLVAEKKLRVLGPRITSTAVVVRLAPPMPGVPPQTILVTEGSESEAVATLQMLSTRRPFVIVGVHFAVQVGDEKRRFSYPVERTPEGQAAFEWSVKSQDSGAARKGMS